MSENHPNPQYYRDYLFVPGDNNPAPPQGPPPAYEPEQLEQPNPGQSQPATPAPAANNPSLQLLTFQIPLNTNVVGGVQSVTTKYLSCATPFATGYIQICGQMGLPVDSAHLGYKFHQRDAGPPHALSTEEDWKDLLDKGHQYLLRRRTRDVICKIVNLDPAKTVATTNATTSRKRKNGRQHDENDPKRQATDYSGYKTEERELEEKYKCSVHKGRCCYVMGDGHHEFIEPYELSLWAKELSLARAKGRDNPSVTTPPHNIVYQRFFVNHSSQLDRRPGRQARPVPEIHVHLPPVEHMQAVATAQAPITHDAISGATPKKTTSSSVASAAAPASSSLPLDSFPYRRSPLADITSMHTNLDSSASVPFGSTTAMVAGEPAESQPLFTAPVSGYVDQPTGLTRHDSWEVNVGAANLLDDDVDSAVVTYPSVMASLKLMDSAPGPSGVRMVDYFTRLQEFGFEYVHSVTLLAFDWSFFSDIIGMPANRVQDFIEICNTMTLRAQSQATYTSK